MSKLLLTVILGLVIACDTAVFASDPQPSPAERMKAAADLSSLDGATLKPWHWVIDATLFDMNGKNPKVASIEAWVSGTSMKTVETLGTASVTTLRVGDQLYRSGTVFSDQPNLDLLLREMVHPVPDELLLPLVKMKLKAEKAGNDQLDCLYPEVPQPATEVVSIGRRLSYCLIQNTSMLLATYSPVRIEVRQRLGSFQGKEVPVDFALMYQSTQLASLKTTKLESYTPQAEDFNPSDEMTHLTGPIEVSQATLVDQVLAKTPPTYPAMAKARHAEGTIKFDAIIGTDGHISKLTPTGSSDPDLLQSATDAVNQWVYRPFTICGLPMQVKTVITVNFNLGN